MGRSHIVALLAGVGITLMGPMTHDAVALAMALESGQAKALERFVKEYPHSPYRDEAIQLAKSDDRSDKGRGNGGNKGNNGNNGNNGHGDDDHGDDDHDHGHGHGNNGHGDHHDHDDDDDDDGYHG